MCFIAEEPSIPASIQGQRPPHTREERKEAYRRPLLHQIAQRSSWALDPNSNEFAELRSAMAQNPLDDDHDSCVLSKV